MLLTPPICAWTPRSQLPQSQCPPVISECPCWETLVSLLYIFILFCNGGPWSYFLGFFEENKENTYSINYLPFPTVCFTLCYWSPIPDLTSLVFITHMLPSTHRLFPGTPWPHSARVTTVWLCMHRVRVLDWPACSPHLSPIENVWCIMKRRIRQWRPQTVEQLKSCIYQEWAKIPLAKLQKCLSSVPKRLQSVI